MRTGYSSRKSGTRKEYRVLLIVCEGQKTERGYFNRYKERGSGLRIMTPSTTVTDPENLVNFALSQIKKLDLDLKNGDQVWCVFDADHHTDAQITKAKSLAKGQVNLCLSNPCFELWYVLHFEYFDSRISTNDLQRKVERHIQNYDKAKDYFDVLLSKRDSALHHAKKLKQKHDLAGTTILSTQCNPSTQVYELVEYILEVIRQNKR